MNERFSARTSPQGLEVGRCRRYGRRASTLVAGALLAASRAALVSVSVSMPILTATATATMFLVPPPAPLQAAPGKSAAASYEHARQVYFQLKADAKKRRFRHHWLKAIAAFRATSVNHPATLEAAKAWFTAGELWRGLHRISRRGADLDEALEAYAEVPRAYRRAGVVAAKQMLADDALWYAAEIHRLRGREEKAVAQLRHLLTTYPKGDMQRRARAAVASSAQAVQDPGAVAAELKPVPREADSTKGSGPQKTSAGHAGDNRLATFNGRGQRAGRKGEAKARVLELKHWTSDDYSRVAVYFSGPVLARSAILPAQGKEPARLYVDVSTAVVDKRRDAKVDDALLTAFRVAQFDKETVRIVLDLKAPASHRLMVMEKPFRVVVDAAVRGAVLSKRARHVVLDAGHGGKDTGAVGHGKLLEKDVVLSVTQVTAKVLRAAGVKVTLSRDDDSFLTLEERTALANRMNADLFVSVHANAAKESSAWGIETYYLNVTDDRYSLRLAAVENQTSEDDVSDLQLILADMSTKAHTLDSRALARRIQGELIKGAKKHNPKVRDHGVKASLFYVLLGARMPAVLVETSFVTNPTEAKLLKKDSYRRSLGTALANAILEHLKHQSSQGDERERTL